MKILLDTQAFIWWDNDRNRLSAKALKLCEDAENSLYLSLASIWEMQIKIHIGKLTLPIPLNSTIELQTLDNDLRLLPIRLKHIYQIASLPNHHKDPFDRILIAQATTENLAVVTVDTFFKNYPIKVIW